MARMSSTSRTAAALLLVALGGAAHAQQDDATSFAKWRAERLEALTGETGWLTLVGLYWFKDGVNTFGRARANAVRIDNPQLNARAGRFVVGNGGLRFESAKGGCVRLEGSAVTSIAITPDTGGEPTLLTCGTLEFFVIERGGKFGLRVRDEASRARREFRGLEYFAFDPAWVVDARFDPYEPHRHVPIVNVLGMELDMESPGAIVFARGGREWRLDTLLEGPDAETLFVMFADGTSSHETYGAGRFMYIPLPTAGRVVVDFNRAHSPPCAFTAYATCPLPPAQNRIALRVDAGERYDGASRH